MAQLVLALNRLGKVDTAFICVCAGIVVAIVAIYFLMPVFKKAQYQQQIDNLRAREAAMKAAKEGKVESDVAENVVSEDVVADDNVVSTDTQETSAVSEDVAE